LRACALKGYNSHVEKATVSRLKNSLSAYLRKVRAGHSVVVYDRDIPIARIDRIEDRGAGDDRLALLAAQGITRPPEAELSAKRLRQALSRPLARSVRLLDAVLEERREGR
jgi:antitoxin (DNA-binding transcriptional repressor) of toxin-antitoxin stability system